MSLSNGDRDRVLAYWRYMDNQPDPICPVCKTPCRKVRRGDGGRVVGCNNCLAPFWEEALDVRECLPMSDQAAEVLAYILEHGHITQNEGLHGASVGHVASRISALKMLGFPIKKEMVPGINARGKPTRYAKYTLEERG